MEKVGNKLNTGFPICLFSCGSLPLYKHCPPHIDFLIFEPAHFEALTFSFKKMNLFKKGPSTFFQCLKGRSQKTREPLV